MHPVGLCPLGVIPQVKAVREETNVNLSVGVSFLQGCTRTDRGEVSPAQSFIQAVYFLHSFLNGIITLAKKSVVLDKQSRFAQKQIEGQFSYIPRRAPNE